MNKELEDALKEYRNSDDLPKDNYDPFPAEAGFESGWRAAFNLINKLNNDFIKGLK